MVDHNTIRNRCAEIIESVDRLREIKKCSLQTDFLLNQDLQDICCFRLIRAIEAALNICYHISAKQFRQTPEDYASCFVVLEKQKLIDKELSSRLQQMAKFRNLLVHMYFKIDFEAVYNLIEEGSNDLEKFCEIATELI